MTEEKRRPQKEIALELLRAGQIVSHRDLREAGVHAKTVERLIREGAAIRIGDRGLYGVPGADVEEWRQTVAVGARIGTRFDAFRVGANRPVVCLATAAALHLLTTDQRTHLRTLWLALPYGSRAPRTPEGFRIGVVRWFRPGEAPENVEPVDVEGREMLITTPARTVVDLFRYRHRRDAEGRAVVPPDLVAEALRTALQKGVDPDEMYEIAKRFRVHAALAPAILEMSADINRGAGRPLRGPAA